MSCSKSRSRVGVLVAHEVTSKPKGPGKCPLAGASLVWRAWRGMGTEKMNLDRPQGCRPFTDKGCCRCLRCCCCCCCCCEVGLGCARWTGFCCRARGHGEQERPSANNALQRSAVKTCGRRARGHVLPVGSGRGWRGTSGFLGR